MHNVKGFLVVAFIGLGFVIPAHGEELRSRSTANDANSAGSSAAATGRSSTVPSAAKPAATAAPASRPSTGRREPTPAKEVAGSGLAPPGYEIIEISDSGIMVRDASGKVMRLADVEKQAQERLEQDTVVTGARHEEQSWATLSSVSTIRREDLERYPYFFLGDFLAMLPGLDVRWGKMQRMYVGLRGLGGTTLNSRVLLLWDGIPLNDPFAGELTAGHFVPLADIERIEVVRGPGSTLYGANAFSGVVNIITGSPKERYLRGSVTTGSFLTSRAQVAFKQPAGPLQVRGSVEAFRSDGPFPEVERREVDQIEAIKNDDVKSVSAAGSLEYHGLRLSARYTIGERGRPGTFPIDSAGRVQQCSNCHNASSSFGQGVKYPATQTSCGSCHIQGSDREQSQQLNLALSYHHKLSKGWTLSGNAYHHEWRRDYRIRRQEGFLRTTSFIEPELNQRTSGGEVRLSHSFRRMNTVLFGGGAKHLASESDLIEREGGGNSASQTEASGFVEDEFRPWRWVALTAGTRLDYNTAFKTAVSPRGGLMFLPIPGLALRAAVARAFRNPSLAELYVVDTRGRYRVEGNPALQREWITTVEGGVGYTLTDPIKLRVAATAFHNVATDLIGFRAVDNDVATFFNFEGVKSTGVELEAEVQFWDKPQLAGFANYTFQHVRTDDGEELPYAPVSKVNFGLRASYKQAGGLVRLRYVGDRRDDLGIDVAGFVTVDVAAHFEVWRGLAMQLWIQNLADESFQDSLGIPGPPRSFYITLSYAGD